MEPAPATVGTVGGALNVAPVAEPDVTEDGEMDPHWAPGAGVAAQATGVPSESRFAFRAMESLVAFPFPSNEVAVIVWVALISMVFVEGVTTRVLAFGFLTTGSQAEAKTISASVSKSRNELRFIAWVPLGGEAGRISG